MGYRALILQSNRMMAEYYELLARDCGYAVDLSDHGGEAVELAGLHDYDVILAGQFLPDMAGHAAVRKMRNTGVRAPVIVTNSRRTCNAQAFAAGADHVFEPEFGETGLQSMMYAAIRRYRGYWAKAGLDLSRKQYHVLIVDIEEWVVKSTETILKACGHQVYCVDLGEDGIDLVKAYEYDLIYLATYLADMSSLQAVREMLAADVTAPIVLFGPLHEAVVSMFLDAGCDYCQDKPFGRQPLKAQARTMIERYRRGWPRALPERAEVKAA